MTAELEIAKAKTKEIIIIIIKSKWTRDLMEKYFILIHEYQIKEA